MSIDLVRSEIERFLSTDEPEVICISGAWGVGKTFAWNTFLKDAQVRKKIALGRYSYVSLFGVNSLEEFKYSIFENSSNPQTLASSPALKRFGLTQPQSESALGRPPLAFCSGLRS